MAAIFDLPLTPTSNFQTSTYFKFTGRHLGFSTSDFFPFGRTTLPLFPLDSWTQNHWFSRQNLVACYFVV